MPDFRRGAASIHYESDGHGPPLLLIAGTASDSASWAPLLARLPGHRLFRIDNRGSGRTRVEGELRHDDMIGDCVALLDHLDLETVDVVGHSLGAFLALCLAERHPARVRRLVSLSFGRLDGRITAMFSELARLGFTLPPEDFFRLLYPWLFSAPFFADPANIAAAAAASTAYPYRQSPGDFARQIAAMDHPATLDPMRIACPVLALTGADDLIAPPAAVAALHDTIPDHTTSIIPAAAHSIHWDQPAAVADAIRAFLGEV